MQSPVLIVLLIGVGVLSLVGVQIYKRIEQARLERMRRIAQLTHAYRLTQRYLSTIPDQYLTPEIRIFILERAIFYLNKLIKEDRKNSLYPSKLLLNQESLRELTENPKIRHTQPISDGTRAREVCALLGQCCRFVDIQSRQGLIDTTKAHRFIQEMTWKSNLCMAEFHIQQSESVSSQADHRLAIYHLNNAILKLKECGNNEAGNKLIKEYQQKLEKEQALLELKETVKVDSSTKLNQELENYLEEDKSDPRKAHYDE